MLLLVLEHQLLLLAQLDGLLVALPLERLVSLASGLEPLDDEFGGLGACRGLVGCAEARELSQTRLELRPLLISHALACKRLFVRLAHEALGRVGRLTKHIDLAPECVALALEARPLTLCRLHASRQSAELLLERGSLARFVGHKLGQVGRQRREGGRGVARPRHVVEQRGGSRHAARAAAVAAAAVAAAAEAAAAAV